MARIELVGLAVTGDSQQPATISFGPRLTVVHGASNTGKSYIFDAIDFLLGASDIKEIDEAAAYELASLVARTQTYPGGLTLERPISGKSRGFKLYENPSASGAPRSLSSQHSNKSDRNISAFLLGELGLQGRWVRTNDQNETHSLSFRNVSQLTMVNEADIVKLTPPPFSGQWTTRTKERSVLKILLQGEDDSYLPRVTKSDIANRQQNQGKLAALEQIATDIRFSLAGGETEESLLERRGRLQGAIDDAMQAVGNLVQRRSSLAEARRQLEGEYDGYSRRINEIGELLASFALLAAKYESDLERLGMLEEAGTLLGYFDVGTCVFCGALPEHQSVEAHRVEDRSLFAQTVNAEEEKTRGLREDLQYAIGDLSAESERLSHAVGILEGRRSDILREIIALDERLGPQQSDMRQLIAAKEDVERKLAAYDQLSHIERIRVAIPTAIEPSSVPASSIAPDTAAEFARVIFEILEAWQVPEVDRVSFDIDAGEVAVNGVPRASHGKGMRALIHAAFTLGLAQWCIERDLPHPGFVVLDSPLLTYKEPETAEDRRLSESSVSGEFFRYLASTFKGQAVVLENVAPPRDLANGAVVYEFTKSDQGRYGFFPRQGAAS